ncbi:MAG: DoxX family protein [Defluviicoccus sp.]|nr:DoxX family protein [Defluviicoccus sp.]MDG4592499.1 DoxX family protein [Defluviicoccus sp.]MDS4071934.1 DoxX family protein [Defluviicoccus sp.]
MATTLSHPLRSGSLTGSIIAGRALLEKFPTSILALAFRLAVAVVFFRSGLTKIASWDATVALFDMEYMVPVLPAAFAAYLATATELGASALVACGLFTRFAAAALLGMTLVIQLFVYPENWPDHLLWGSILAYLVTRGPGALSIDHLIAGRLFEDQQS